MITQYSQSDWENYELLDSGAGMRLEKIGSAFCIRPEPNARWNPHNPNHEGWQSPTSQFKPGQGWVHHGKGFREGCEVAFRGVTVKAQPTAFRHIGFFPEQGESWEWLAKQLSDKVAHGNAAPKVLNLFAYTGMGSLISAKAGAEVCHVDSAKGSVFWASENAALNNMRDAHIRWIVDDVRKFVGREVRRAAKYDAVVLDPPVFGRGAKGEVWRLEEDLPELLADIREIVAPNASFLLHFYSTEWYPLALQRTVEDILQGQINTLELASVGLADQGGKYLQTGFVLRG